MLHLISVMEDAGNNVTSPRTSQDQHTVTFARGSSCQSEKKGRRPLLPPLLPHPYRHTYYTASHVAMHHDDTLGIIRAASDQQQEHRQQVSQSRFPRSNNNSNNISSGRKTRLMPRSRILRQRRVKGGPRGRSRWLPWCILTPPPPATIASSGAGAQHSF